MSHASPAEVSQLQRRFTAAMTQLEQDFGRILTDIAEHPRYNEKLDRARTLLGRLEEAASILRMIVSVDDKRGEHEVRLLELLEGIMTETKALADENALHPASVITRSGGEAQP